MKVIDQNVTDKFVNRHIGIAGKDKFNTMEKLASGYKVNKAADDVAGIAISESMRGQIRGLDQATKNAEDGQNLIATADAGMSELDLILHRMKELCVQGANDTNSDDERESLQLEIDALNNEIDRITDQTEFNTIKLLRGTTIEVDEADEEDIEDADYPIGFQSSESDDRYLFQVGSDSNHTVSVNLPMIDTSILRTRGIMVSDCQTATKSIAFVDYAVDIVNYERTRMGAIANRLGHAHSNSTNASDNTSASESKIRDADLADEMVKLATSRIIEEAGIAMTAQVNNNKKTILAMVE